MSKIRKSLTEDWIAVIAGFLIIGITLLFERIMPSLLGESVVGKINAIIPKLPVFYSSKEQWFASDFFDKFFTTNNFYSILYFLLFFMLFAFLVPWITRRPKGKFVLSFAIVFLLAFIAQMVAAHTAMKSLNLETVFFSVIIGLLVGNLFKLPEWMKSAVLSEYFIKIGLVLLGTTVLFNNIMKAGALGMIQALVVVMSVWYIAFWISRRMKIDNETSMLLASSVSICGVSAAIATNGAINGDSKKLSYVVSLVLVVAIPMMLFMPYLAVWLGLSQEVAGAWIGGTIDTTGAVVASGTIIGNTAKDIAVIIKSAQNVLLGVAAFAISIYWSYANKSVGVEKPTAGVIWQRFPKFVIGFIAASLLFSFVLSPDTVTKVGSTLKGYQTIWFSLAFVCIGLETRFADVFNQENRKPMYAFLLAQLINVIITLAVAYLLFSGMTM
ncbi:YeiH family protein [Alistipes sp. ZOR0009]|jgi:uncharacterized integral membrane protein (TIGR00698 family)|uniref:YeiH family protein n=1 Tax=Alistipes sp. ZOR0009 TaxID=1339253 RepID=UPI0006469D0E|nr:putative sulfate exporter family transporter [Alistipes sp. ZOR0009]